MPKTTAAINIIITKYKIRSLKILVESSYGIIPVLISRRYINQVPAEIASQIQPANKGIRPFLYTFLERNMARIIQVIATIKLA